MQSQELTISRQEYEALLARLNRLEQRVAELEDHTLDGENHPLDFSEVTGKETAIASEQSLAKVWLTPAEDEAWRDL